MAEDYVKAYNKEWARLAAGARRIDIGPMFDLYRMANRQEAKLAITQSIPEMRKLHDELPNSNFKSLGQQSLIDAPMTVPFEKVLFDKTGILHKRGDPWVCRKCGCRMEMALPMDKCPRCGAPSIIADKTVNLRN
jgi:rubrerythrin